jgi:hypothetical protein
VANFLNSRWFLIVKSALLAAALWLTQQDGQAAAQKAAGLPVTAVDLPDSFVPILAIGYGLLQSGQEKPK